MGYDLHITRRELFTDDGPAIAAEEWLALIRSDPDLELLPDQGPCFARYLGPCSYGDGAGWFDWEDGCVFTKNPDEALLGKMLRMAEALGARVQGDDGETYHEPDFETGFTRPAPVVSAPGRLAAVIERLRSLFAFRGTSQKLPFRVGDRVRDPWGQTGVVVRISRGGLGEIEVRYDDGRMFTTSAIAHWWEPTG